LPQTLEDADTAEDVCALVAPPAQAIPIQQSLAKVDQMTIRTISTSTLGVALLALTACSEGPTGPSDGGFAPQLLVAPAAVREAGVVCVASTVPGTYTFTASLTLGTGSPVVLVGDAADGNFTLAEEECTTVATGAGVFSTVNIVLTGAPAGALLDNVEKNQAVGETNGGTLLTTTDLGAVTASDGRVGIEFGFVNVYEFVPLVDEGCTHTIGYWKTHAGFTGNNADVVTQYLPIWLGTSGGASSVQVTTAAQARTILSTMGSNGIDKLKAQLLGAKLSIADGADATPVAAVIAAADAFLAANTSASWAGLTKAQKAAVNGWMGQLDSYNNGLSGVSHCDYNTTGS
jgi:hypothetical protein